MSRNYKKLKSKYTHKRLFALFYQKNQHKNLQI